MIALAVRNLARRPVRLALTLIGLALAVGLSSSLLAFAEGYQVGLRAELDRMGIQMMLVPLGCPYDGAARALKGRPLDDFLPASVLADVRRDSRVAVAAPMLIGAFPEPEQRRTDLWTGIDPAMRALKPWWRCQAGTLELSRSDDVLLGADAAETEMRAPGDLFYSPAMGRRFRVAGVLQRSGTSDDNLFFISLPAAQEAFRQQDRLSAVAVRLKDPADLTDVMARFQRLPGVQVVTMTEMLGTFLNLVGSARAMVAAILLVAFAISSLSIFNTMLASVLERTRELVTMRAVGASAGQLFTLVALEAALLGLLGAALGIALAACAGTTIETAIRASIPLAPEGRLLRLAPAIALECGVAALLLAIAAALYPAYRASRLQPAEALRIE